MYKKLLNLIFLAVLLIINVTCKNKEVKEVDRMDWWRESRFGLFIHWGLYAIPAGEWNGSTNHAEWIRESARIPLKQYDEFVSQFNPAKFNADKWVTMAKNAGMKYIVITSKHHDGFCLFDSKETDFDVMSTPFKRDILKELSDACAKQGLTLCFYHSIMDWHNPDYLPRRIWETDRPAAGADYEKYVSYMKNQLNELLTNYGKIGVIWFDGEWESTWTHERGKALYEYLRKMRPDLIINNRVDKGRTDMAGMTKDTIFCGDFGTPEQEIPSMGLPGLDWESCMTMNDHWGYNKNDQNWKSSEDLVRKLIDIASKGGNFLLNIGPTSEGLFPDTSIERLKDMGAWMRENSESIYGTQASPFQKLEWGRCTQKVQGRETILYLHVFNWPIDGKLVIPGLTNKIVKAYALNDNKKQKLPVKKTGAEVSVTVSNITRSNYATVVVLKIKGKPVVDE
jgi:alpha-L-fucosidase